MPELPEVTTTVNGLNKTIKGLTISDVWTDLAKDKPIKQFEGTIKDNKFLTKFKKEIAGQKVIISERRAKNILIHLSNKKIILIHLKMTGHLLYGKYIYNKKENKWSPDSKEKDSLKDPFNRFVHVVFSFTNGKHLAFSDSRKFGKVTLLEEEKHKEKHGLNKLGPEPLDEDFTYIKFKNTLSRFPLKPIKTVLMDQSIISGIGNIYSDEMLHLAHIHPESKLKNIPEKNMKELYSSMKKVLQTGIDFGGDSMSDYRNIHGEKGNFQNKHNVYQKKNEKCNRKNCKGIIEKKVIGTRSSHFCNTCQILF